MQWRTESLYENSPLPAGAARSFRQRGASVPCFPKRGKASAPSAGAETADSRPPLASEILVREYAGREAVFEATDDFVRATLPAKQVR